MGVRECGTCTACCKTHPIHRVQKPAGAWCIHCDIGKGCKVYEIRPDECRAFVCQWLKHFGEEDERPDTTKIVIDYYTVPGLPELGTVAALFEVAEGAFDRAYAKKVETTFIENKTVVLLRFLNGREELYIPCALNITKEILKECADDTRRVFVSPHPNSPS